MGANLPAVIDTTAVAASAERFMPVMSMQLAVRRYNELLDFTKQIMKDRKDYGCVPGVDKPSLLKPGAEKLCNFFGLTPTFEIVEKAELWDAEEPFFFYFYKAKLWRGQDLIGEGDGSCNSRESKYRYRWVGESQLPEGASKAKLTTRGGRTSEFEFAIEKADTAGKYGKPAAYWQSFKDAIANKTAALIQKPIKDGRTFPAWEIDCTVYRVPNPDVCDQVNTIQKMAQKRALVAATLIACNASEYYTQDIEDMDIIDVTPIPSQQHKPPIATAGPEKGAAATAPPGETSGRKSEEARNDVKSQAGPTMVSKPASVIPAGVELPPEVKALWDRMGNKKAEIVEVIAELHSDMVEVVGSDDANRKYDEIKRQFAGGADPTSQVGFSRRVVLEMWKAAQAMKAEAKRDQQKAQEPEPGQLFPKEVAYAD
jgi:hypothetical protein